MCVDGLKRCVVKINAINGEPGYFIIGFKREINLIMSGLKKSKTKIRVPDSFYGMNTTCNDIEGVKITWKEHKKSWIFERLNSFMIWYYIIRDILPKDTFLRLFSKYKKQRRDHRYLLANIFHLVVTQQKFELSLANDKYFVTVFSNSGVRCIRLKPQGSGQSKYVSVDELYEMLKFHYDKNNVKVKIV